MTSSNNLEMRLTDLEQRVAKLEKQSPSLAPRVSGKKQSAKEFLISKITKTETQKVLALAYFLEHMEGQASFNVPDLETAFRGAKEKLPKNLNDAVNKNISKGFLMEAETKKDSKKAWYLTATGERYVESEMTS